jgi:hypothetical protein
LYLPVNKRKDADDKIPSSQQTTILIFATEGASTSEQIPVLPSLAIPTTTVA